MTDIPDPERTLAAGEVLPPPGPALPELPGYLIEREIGRGGMGVVYKARQMRVGRDVALKMVLSGAQAGGADRARFQSEIEAVAHLQHPNIVAIHDVGECDNRPYFSMEFCPAGSLAGRLARGNLSYREAAELLLAITQGVIAAHAAGIVHRDLKPGNILLTTDGVPKIADFGLARRVGRSGGELTATGAVLGTPGYMAPEQAGSARSVGPAADVYGLGAILYECLTGKPPFQGPTVTDTLLMLLTEDPVPPRELCPEVPRDLEAICLRALEKEPTRRYPSAIALASDLKCYLDGEPVAAGRSGLLDKLVGALDRVQLQEKLSAHATLLLALAPVMFLPEIWMFVVAWNNWPASLFLPGQFGRIACFVGLVAWSRRGRLLPAGPAERQLWWVWGGYVLTCLAHGLSTRAVHGLFSTQLELQIYQGLACLAALAFFALTPTLWGYFAVIGACFLVLPFLMALDLRFAPLEFGTVWVCVLVVMGLRLRGLARKGVAVQEQTQDS